MVFMEWVQYTLTPFASWGAMAYTQVDNHQLIQSVSLFGMAGLGFLIYLCNMVVAQSLVEGKIPMKRLMVPVAMILVFLFYGAIRYDYFKSQGRDSIKVAAVGTDSMAGGLPLPSDAQRHEDMRTLLERTRAAAMSGPEMIVWNEAALVILPEEERIWKDTLSALANEVGASLVASYVVVLEGESFQFENKYVLYASDGSLISEYYKEEPVPGEPAIVKPNDIGFSTINGAKVSGAICYDFDFPYMGRRLNQADIVGLPASDWRGIDPIHTKMAAFRAIEQGNSIVRSTRWGLSAAINPMGEFTSQMSDFDQNDKIMIGYVPAKSIFTVYRVIGDLFVFVCLGFAIYVMIWGKD